MGWHDLRIEEGKPRNLLTNGPMNATRMTLRTFALEIAEQEIELIQALNQCPLTSDSQVALRKVLKRSLLRITNWLDQGKQDRNALPEPKAASAEAAEIIQVLTESNARQRMAKLERAFRDLSLSLLYMDVCQARLENENANGGRLTTRVREESGAIALVIDEARCALANIDSLSADTPVETMAA